MTSNTQTAPSATSLTVRSGLGGGVGGRYGGCGACQLTRAEYQGHGSVVLQYAYPYGCPQAQPGGCEQFAVAAMQLFPQGLPVEHVTQQQPAETVQVRLRARVGAPLTGDDVPSFWMV